MKRYRPSSQQAGAMQLRDIKRKLVARQFVALRLAVRITPRQAAAKGERHSAPLRGSGA